MIERTVSRAATQTLSLIGCAAIVAVWVLFRMAAIEQPGYEPMRDTISSLASEGASHAWIGMLGIATAGGATVIASFPLRRISQPAALAMGVAGFALVLVALTRIACPDGAASCSMGPATDYSTATAHTIGQIVFEVLFVGAIGSAAICLWRAGARVTSTAAVVGMVLSILLFTVFPIEIGMQQRLWLFVNSILMVGCLLLPFHPVGQSAPGALRRGRPNRGTSLPIRAEA